MKKNSNIEAIKRLRELLVWSFILGGLVLLVISFFPIMPEIQIVLRGFALSLTPVGIVTLILSRYASSITELLLRESVENTISNQLSSDMENIEKIFSAEVNDISSNVKNGINNINIEMKQLAPIFASSTNLGLEDILLTRGIALSKFAWYLDAEAQKAERGEESRVWIISSSFKGFLESTSEHFDGRRMMRRIASNNSCELRILMTDPEVADLRAKQERRSKGEIPEEVKMNLSYLKRIGVRRESVKYYTGTPTVFAIATRDRMLLNPYPYQTEAFRCFSIIVHKTLNPKADIFHQYIEYHFEEPWRISKPIPSDYWDSL